MIITVKTLDSQNHQFTVQDNFTVEQFKNHIEEKVNIPAARQRIIYCGRVLQDSSKLSEYDVDGKVVHLVQRAPPSAQPRNVRSITPPPDLGRARGGFNRVGNTVYMGMGSMTLPQGLMDPQQRINSRATHTLSGSRLNVARRMLRSAENIVRQLENPSGNNEQAPAEEPVEEEMTPVIEARVIVPSHSGQPIDENAIVNAVENTIFAAGSSNMDPNAIPSTSSTTQSTDSANGRQSSSSTPEVHSSTPYSSNENLNNTESNPGVSTREGPRPSRMRCRGTEMAELLTTLNQLQARFAPFLTQYQTFMQDDPAVTEENLQDTRQMLSRVSQVLHYLGHAYHSLSDIMINVEHPPPRLLLCRPILIQHSAVVQAGIPIQLEAQINLSADRPGSTPNNTGTNTSTTGTTTSTTATQGTATPNVTPNPTPNGQAQPGGPSITLQPGFVGLPFAMPSSMHVITTPVEIHTVRQPVGAVPPRVRPPNNNNNTTTVPPTTEPSTNRGESAPPPQATPPQAPPMQAQFPQATPSQQQATPPTTGQAPPIGGPFAAMGSQNGGNLEFFMEVTPEVLRGGNLIQSLMQLVGSQLGGTIGPPQTPGQAPPQNVPSGGDPAQQGQTAGGAQAQGPNFSQSQARSTQTNPTTATHTRSTPRPHVHMTQQAVQGGFDPFLPCYSHHVTHTRGQRIVSMGPQQSNRQEPAAARQTTSTTGQRPGHQAGHQPNQQPPAQPPPPTFGGANAPPHMANLTNQFEHLVRGMPHNIGGSMADFSNMFFENPQAYQSMTDMVMNAMRVAGQQAGPLPHQAVPPQRGAPDGQGAPPPSQAPPAPPPPNQQQFRMEGSADILGFISRSVGQDFQNMMGPTLDEYLQPLHPAPYVQGESIIIDLIMLMLRNLRLNDVFLITSGNMTPLHRQMGSVQSFFLTDVLQNDTTDAGINRATERIINDLRPLITAMQSIPPIANVDMVATIDGFFRRRVPDIIRLAISTTGDAGQNGANLITMMWRVAKELLALAIACSIDGPIGVETALEEVMFSTIFNQQNIPMDVHQWTVVQSRMALRNMIENLDVNAIEVGRYIVDSRRTVPVAVPEVPARNAVLESRQESHQVVGREESAEVESMEVEYAASPSNTLPVLETAVEDTEPLPNVIWGSESWHRQTPEDWVPIITRDIQRQRRQNPQPPFSDAYLSGMPSKRRKIINNSKPQGSLSHLISESVRQAVTATGLTTAAPLETVAQAAGQSTEIQSAYRTLLRTSVQSNLRDNEDFTPERFPNISNYFNEAPPE